jgi:hypothetical protein
VDDSARIVPGAEKGGGSHGGTVCRDRGGARRRGAERASQTDRGLDRRPRADGARRARGPSELPPGSGHHIDHSTSHGHRVTFDYAADTGTVHHFTLSSITIFHSATVHHTTEGWRFYHYDSHYIVHGHWLNHWTVVGSICNLHIDPTGCRTSGSQSFEAVFPHAKPLEGPWMGTTDSGANDVTFTLGPSLTGSGNLVIFDLNIHPPEWTYSNFYSSRNGPLETNSDGAWHFYRDGNYDLVSATWTDPAHMHGHVCDKGAYGCKPAYTFTFTAHAVGYTPGGAR